MSKCILFPVLSSVDTQLQRGLSLTTFASHVSEKRDRNAFGVSSRHSELSELRKGMARREPTNSINFTTSKVVSAGSAIHTQGATFPSYLCLQLAAAPSLAFCLSVVSFLGAMPRTYLAGLCSFFSILFLLLLSFLLFGSLHLVSQFYGYSARLFSVLLLFLLFLFYFYHSIFYFCFLIHFYSVVLYFMRNKS